MDHVLAFVLHVFIWMLTTSPKCGRSLSYLVGTNFIKGLSEKRVTDALVTLTITFRTQILLIIIYYR